MIPNSPKPFTRKFSKRFLTSSGIFGPSRFKQNVNLIIKKSTFFTSVTRRTRKTQSSLSEKTRISLPSSQAPKHPQKIRRVSAPHPLVKTEKSTSISPVNSHSTKKTPSGNYPQITQSSFQKIAPPRFPNNINNFLPEWVNLAKHELLPQSRKPDKRSLPLTTSNSTTTISPIGTPPSLDSSEIKNDEKVLILDAEGSDTKMELQIGDFLRNRSENILKNTSLLPNGHEILHRDDDVAFRVPGYAYSKINACALAPSSPIPSTYGRTASNFFQASLAMMQLKNMEFRKVYSHYVSPNEDEHTTVSIADVARFVFQTDQPQHTQLFAAHIHLLKDNIHYTTDPSLLRRGEILVRPKFDVRAIETVLKSIRLKDAEFLSFLSKSQHIIKTNRSLAKQNCIMPSLEKSTNIAEFSPIDQMFIRFIRISIFSKDSMSHVLFDAPVSAILKPLKIYNGLLDRDCAIQFLMDIGVWAPWENLIVYEPSIGLHGHGNSTTSDDTHKKSLELAQRFLKTQPPFVYNALESKNNIGSNNVPPGIKALSLLIRSSPSVLGAEEFYPRDICQEIRHDFGNLRVYTIDDINAHEIDDGISIERIESTGSEPESIWLHIHIADPSAYIHPEHQFAKEASIRGQTLYFPERVYPMMPGILSEQRFSLGAGKESGGHCVLSFSIRLNKDGSFLEYKIRPGIVRQVQKLNYDYVDTILSWDNIPGGKEEAELIKKHCYFHPSPVSTPMNNEGISEIPQDTRRDLLDLQKFATNHLKHRIRNGGFNFQLPSPVVSVSPFPLPVTFPYPNTPTIFSGLPSIQITLDNSGTSPSHTMIAELMIMAGRAAAQFCSERQIPILYRCQSIPSENLTEQVNGSVDLETGCMPITQVLKTRGFMGPVEISDKSGPHWLMGIPNGYSKVTSPLRRFSDLIAHWQIKAALLDLQFPFSEEQILKMAPVIQNREKEAKKLNNTSLKFWMCMLMKRLKESGNLLEFSCISLEEITGEKPAYPVLVKELGIQARLKTDQKSQVGDILKAKVTDVFPYHPSLELATTQNVHCPGIDYLIVIDFEATCDENANPQALQVTKETAEIIEFAWVIVDTSSLEVVYQHTQHVKPEVTPLTNFCTTLTKITWEQLNSAGTLQEAITSLDSYIQSFIIADSKTFCFCTHGAWDLRIQLPREARDKNIDLPSYLAHCRMFDLKQEYQRWQVHHPDVKLKTQSLGEMCEAFELPVVGPQHSGLNDSLTMVHIIRYFCSFSHPDVFVNPIDTNADLNQFKKEQSKVIHLAGLPFDVTQPELEAWFSGQGVRPQMLWMIRTPDHQKPSGSGFGIFATHDDAMACLNMNGRTLGDRAIEVSPSSERVIEAAGAILAQFPMTKTRLRPGDWVCLACQFHNFASRRTCFKCNVINPHPIPVTPPNFTIGDWMCPTPQCNFHNYASRTQCLRCGNFKPPNLYGPAPSNNVAFRPGDWMCLNPNCLFQNFASRSHCMRCGSANHIGFEAYPTGDHGGFGGGGHPSSSPAAAPFRPGDWYCPACNSHNFASRFQCIRCGIAKPPQIPGSVATATNMKPGDWLCRNEMCGYHNFAKRTQCAKCGMPNSGDGSNGY
ncbi:hypothetical protein G9A89_004452 [Geosiphon pyriformis]|nr:hypothetical protein G9A89_004452 [Geosiphon pyriformis]